MNQKQSPYLLPATLLVDALMLCIAWVLAYYLRFYSYFEITRGLPSFGLYAKLIPFLVMIWILMSGVTGALFRVGHFRRFWRELADLLPSAVLTLMGLIVFSYFYEEYRYSRLTLIVFAFLLPLSLMSGRMLLRSWIYLRRRSLAPKEILILARGAAIRKAFEMSQQLEGGHVSLRGVVLPGDLAKSDDREICSALGLKVIDEPSDWARYFADHPTHTLVVALPNKDYGHIEDKLELIADQVVNVQILPDLARFTRLTPGVQIIEGLPVISLHESPLSGYNLLIKRVFDIVGSSIALMLLSPLMILISICVRISSRGPVFYKQERMSLDGTRFNCLKFRSMPVDAESKTGAVWAKPGDARATPFGSFIRRTSLDELPQLINVLRGDMSLVGPRPERPYFVNQFRTQIPGYMLRHKVKTGITGWAQVNGWRGSTSLEKRIECDLFYIQNWTIWLDLKILILTLDEVFRGRNAY